MMNDSWNSRDETWKKVWKFLGPQRVRFFFWTILKQRLLTNAKRVRRGLAVDPSCPICGHDSEDILHIIRDCMATKENTSKFNRGASWVCFFGLFAWSLWKNCNLFIFQRKTWSSNEIIKVSINWAKQFLLVFRNELIEGYEFAIEEQLTRGWTFLNTDGVVQMESGDATVGRIMYDEKGDWVFGYNRFIGKCSIFMPNCGAS
ncbi:hypothetical protein Golax_010535 [Gossypium laxum]|uniref:Reverse transcriptase zinc-binding domain-containing protein n=1 Tax=Gossypium laxum TaxID=34288 RepID=A0A7J8ZI84_9ROSI|nr:hypothetical protein [Gossypium laxum]